jgi:hypothetical protein
MRNQGLNVIKIIILLALCIFLLGGCKEKSKELVAMLESSISTTALTTGLEIDRSQFDWGEGLIKPTRPEVRIQYKPKNNYTKEDVYEEIIENLEESHWDREEEPGIKQAGFYRAFLPQDGFTIRATVQILSEENIVNVRLITIPR